MSYQNPNSGSDEHPVIRKYETQFRNLFSDLANDFRGQLGSAGGVRGIGNELINQTFGGASGPAIDIYEGENEWIAHVEVAGVPRENITLDVHGQELVISGEYKEHKDLSSHNILRKERKSGSFKRSVTIPLGYKTEDIDAHYQDGILTVKIPRNHAFQPKRISIK
ncbi:1788_t:CDS:2 [Ambispora gerdemannii]|uniref:1788_t:CDS:1 n=1 Tax=Ambispora gerdemannii TaxID=144530 RepID=A0A9N8YQ10_9GLOM|nr:1788_t:CDS:2 [Ambispora gerdemannii]